MMICSVLVMVQSTYVICHCSVELVCQSVCISFTRPGLPEGSTSTEDPGIQYHVEHLLCQVPSQMFGRLDYVLLGVLDSAYWFCF